MCIRDRLRILHDFYRTGEESGFHFDIQENMRKGHSFKDYICPDTFEFEKDYFRMGDRYGRVLFLREYASYIKDDMIAELTDMNRNLMLSIDVIPVPTDEAVQEAVSYTHLVARQLLELGKLSYEEIAKIAKMTTDEVKALDEKVIA